MQSDIQRAECSRAGQALPVYSLHGVTQLHWLSDSVEDLTPISQVQNHTRSQDKFKLLRYSASESVVCRAISKLRQSL